MATIACTAAATCHRWCLTSGSQAPCALRLPQAAQLPKLRTLPALQARQQPGPGQERPGPWPVFESRVVHASEAVGHDDEAGAGRYAHELPPGEVQQTVARLPGVQLLFRSSPPGSEGLVVEHVIAGLTLELQLVQLGAAESSGGGSESSEAPSERSGGLANGLASGTANGSTSRLTARAKLSHEGSGVVVAYRDDAAGSGARVLESPVRGCAAWDSGIGWMVLFDARSQLEHFTGGCHNWVSRWVVGYRWCLSRWVRRRVAAWEARMCEAALVGAVPLALACMPRLVKLS